MHIEHNGQTAGAVAQVKVAVCGWMLTPGGSGLDDKGCKPNRIGAEPFAIFIVSSLSKCGKNGIKTRTFSSEIFICLLF